MMSVASISRAGDAPAIKPVANPYLNVLSGSPQAELPSRAADLVAQAKNQKQATVDVVKAVVGLNPVATPEIVGALAHETPGMAATAAATAVSLVPNQAVSIARAAAAAAPKQSGKIVEAICRVLPQSYKEVAEAVAEVVPGAGKEILTGVAAAIPVFKGSIDAVLASSKGSVPSVSETLAPLANVASTPELSAPQAPGNAAQPLITILPPYVPPPSSPVPFDPGSGGQNTGPRNYSAPPPP